jgi:hypothetical protein
MSAIIADKSRSRLAAWFTPDHDRYEGVRPVNIALLRLLYLLMFIGVAIPSWGEVLGHQGPWDHVRAVAFCVWVAYPTMSLLGLVNPLRMLPLVLFMLFYKTLWVAVVAYPLWASDQLAGSPAEAMARIFSGVWVVYLIMPWGYVLRTYFRFPQRVAGAGPQP